MGTIPQRWLWLGVGAILAVVAAVWLLSVVLHHEGELGPTPAAPTTAAPASR
jgi:hypothetical protein